MSTENLEAVVQKIQTEQDAQNPVPQNTLKSKAYAKIAKETMAERELAKKEVVAEKIEEAPAKEVAPEVVKAEKVEPIKAEQKPKESVQEVEKTVDKYDDIRAILNDEEVGQKDEKKSKDEKTSNPIELDSIYSNPLIEAVVAAVRNGETDLSKIAKNIGLIDANEMTIEDLVTLKAKEKGFEGEELDDAIAEELDYIEGLTRIGKKDIEQSLRAEYKNKSGDKLKSYTENINKAQQEQQQHFQKITDTADTELRQTLAELEGKKRLHMQFDKKMIEEIEKVAPLYTPPILDENGNTIGLNVQEGIDMAILRVYQKIIVKNVAASARQMGYDEAMQEVHRPNANDSSSSASPSTKEEDKGDMARDYYANKHKKKTTF